MPYTLTIEPELVRVVFFGVMTAADLHAMARDVTAIERARVVPNNRLTDLSDVTDIQLTVDHLLASVHERRVQWRALPLRSALVAPRTLSVGYGRMFQTLSEQAAVELFATREDAEVWLAGEAEEDVRSQTCGAAAPEGDDDA